MRFFLFGLAGLLFTSCGVYNSSFDCPPGQGIGCASVGEVLDLIVEREEGEDLFVHDKGSVLLLKQQEKLKLAEKLDVRVPSKKPKKLILSQEESGEWVLIEENT